MNAAKVPSDDLDVLVGEVADEYAERLSRGEKPDIEIIAARHPRVAEQIRGVLRSVEALYALPAAASQDEGPDEHGVLGQLGDYRILRQVGRGGMGIVYEAEQLSLQRRVALKVLPFASALDARRLQRFKNEALAVAQLEHPNIVAVLATGCERGVHFYAMRFVEGQTLADVIQTLRDQGARTDAGPATALADRRAALAPTTDAETGVQRERPRAAADTPPVAELSTESSTANFFRLAAKLGVQVAEGLEHAHQCGILHRDIKPGNLLLDTQGAVSISDFGLAHIGTDNNLTLSGDLLGTLGYMSPEQALAQRIPVDHRTDVYSLGVTLYELLTHRLPFLGKDRHDLLRQIAFDEPVPLRSLNRAVPADLETIVLKAMAKNPGERYVSAQALADDLTRFLTDQPIQARRPGVVQRAAKWTRRHRTVVVTAATTFILALATATLLLWAEQQRTAAAYAGEQQQRHEAEENLDQAEEQKRRALAEKQRADKERAEAERQRDRAEQLRRLAEERELASRRNLYSAQLLLIQHAWERRNLGRMIELLDAQRPGDGPDLRGFEWYFWSEQCRGGRTSMQSGDLVFASAVSADGRTLATGGPPGAIKLWDLPGRRLSSRLSWPGATVLALALSPDGRTLAAAASLDKKGDGQIKLWNLEAGKETHTFGPTGFHVIALAFSPDGKVLASGQTKGLSAWPSPGELTLWDSAEGRKLRNCGGGLEAVTGLVFSPDGKTLASTAGTHVTPFSSGSGGVPLVRLWDPATGQARASRMLHRFPASSVAFSPDASLLAIGGHGAVKLYGARKLEELAALPSGPGTVWSVAFSPDGKTLATANSDETVRFFDTATRSHFASRWHASVTSLAFGPEGRTLASVGGRAISVWTVPPRADSVVWTRHEHWVTGLAFSADGKRLASGSFDGTARTGDFLEAPLDKPRTTFGAGPTARVRAMALSPDGTRLVTAGDQLDLWDVPTGLRRLPLKGHKTFVMAAAFAPDGTTLASADADGVLKLWDGHTGAEQASLQVYAPIPALGRASGAAWHGSGNYVTSLAFSPDGKVLVAAGLKGLKSWDVKTRRPLAFMNKDTQLHQLCTFARDGTLLASLRGMVPGFGAAMGGGGQDVTLWDFAAGTVRGVFRAHGFTPTALALSPDGKTLAVGGNDGTIKLWSVAAQQELATLSGHDASVLALAFDPSGQVLASGSADKTVRLWHAPRNEVP